MGILVSPKSLKVERLPSGVHPLYLGSVSGKFAIQIEQAQSIAELSSLIEEAKYLLDHGNMSIIETALSVGYSDPNYFSKVFHKLEHVTPHDYRKRKKV